MDPPNVAANPLLPKLPDPPETTQWWLITGTEMTFENVGFSKPVQNDGHSSQCISACKTVDVTADLRVASMKLLTCADCDLGPLGWCIPQSGEFWLACSRVGYKEV
jgi:hypothetical protein